MRIINDYSTIIRKIGEDLGWFLGYYALQKAQLLLGVTWDEVQEDQVQEDLFLYTAGKAAEDLLSEKVFHNEKVKLSKSANEEMVVCFSKIVYMNSTLRLSPYLEYIENWIQQDLDWNIHQPASLSNLEIVCYD